MYNLEEEIFNSKVKLQDIYDDIYEDCDSALADDFYKGLENKIDENNFVDLADAEVQLYIRDYLEAHEKDYQYDLLKRALGKYYDPQYDIVDDDIEESYEVLEEDVEEDHTFEEIIDRMEFAEIYEDLYNAAMCIVNPKLQNRVTKAIQQCEEDGDDVEEAYSIVTSDILDMYRNDKNVENLNETKLQEAKDIKTILKELDVSSFEELNEKIEELYNEGEIDEEYDDFIDISSEQEEKCTDYINRRSKVTNTDWKDELGIEEDYVKTAIEEMIKSIKIDENKEIEIESEENSQEFDYRLLSRLKSDCDYYLGNGNRNAEHCLWAKNEQGQIDKMREIYNKLKEKPEWLSEEDINNYAKEMGVVDLPSTADGTAEKEIQDMLDRSEKRSKENLDEAKEEKFSAVEFEKNIPHKMRYKEYDVKDNADGKTLYWITQQFFTLDELEEFQQAFIRELANDKFGFTEAYVTVRDLSHYNLDEDYEDGVLCYITAQSIDCIGYEEACKDYKFDIHKGWLNENKKIIEATDLEAQKMLKIQDWLVRNDFEDAYEEGMIKPKPDFDYMKRQDFNEFINTKRSWVAYKDKSALTEFDDMIKELKSEGKKVTEAEDMEEVKDEIETAKAETENTDQEIEQVQGSLDVLKTDEESAIDGYDTFIEDTKEVVDPELANAIEDQMEEIKADEEEHIEKLDTIKDALDENKEIKKENKIIWTSEYEGDEETAEQAYQEYLDEFEPSAKTPKSFEMWLEDTKEVWFEAEAERYKEENPDKDPDKLTDFELDEINAELYDRVEKEIEANMDDLKEQYKEYCEEIQKEMTSPLDKEKWLTGWYEQDAQAQWEVKDEDFSYSIWPIIENQCNEDILILLGSVGRWNGTSGGGKIIYAEEDNLRNTMSDYDEIRVEADDNNQLSIDYIHHDGTDIMYLYTIPEDLTELAKAMEYDDPDELDTDIRQDYVDMEELSKHVDKLTPIIYKGGNE